MFPCFILTLMVCDKLSVTIDQTRAPRLILFTRLVSTLDLSLQSCYHSARNMKLFLDHYFIFKNRVASRFSRKVFVNKIIFEASLKSLKQSWRITSHYCWRYRTFLSNFAEFIFCDSFPGKKIFFFIQIEGSKFCIVLQIYNLYHIKIIDLNQQNLILILEYPVRRNNRPEIKDRVFLRMMRFPTSDKIYESLTSTNSVFGTKNLTQKVEN